MNKLFNVARSRSMHEIGQPAQSKRFFIWKFHEECEEEFQNELKHKHAERNQGNEWFPFFRETTKESRVRGKLCTKALSTFEGLTYTKRRAKNKIINPVRAEIDTLTSSFRDSSAATDTGYSQYLSFLSMEDDLPFSEAAYANAQLWSDSEHSARQQAKSFDNLGDSDHGHRMRAVQSFSWKYQSAYEHRNPTSRTSITSCGAFRCFPPREPQNIRSHSQNALRKLMKDIIGSSHCSRTKSKSLVLSDGTKTGHTRLSVWHSHLLEFLGSKCRTLQDSTQLQTKESRERYFYIQKNPLVLDIRARRKVFEAVSARINGPSVTLASAKATSNRMLTRFAMAKLNSVKAEQDPSANQTECSPAFFSTPESSISHEIVNTRQINDSASNRKDDEVERADLKAREFITKAHSPFPPFYIRTEKKTVQSSSTPHHMLDFVKHRIKLALSSTPSGGESQDDRNFASLIKSDIAEAFDQQEIPSHLLLSLGRWLIHDLLLDGSASLPSVVSNESKEKFSKKIRYSDNRATISRYEPTFQLLLTIFDYFARHRDSSIQTPASWNSANHHKNLTNDFITSIFSVKIIEDLIKKITIELQQQKTNGLRVDFQETCDFVTYKDEYGEETALSRKMLSLIGQQSRQSLEKHQKASLWENSIKAFSMLERFFAFFGHPPVANALYTPEALSELIVSVSREYILLSTGEECDQKSSLFDFLLYTCKATNKNKAIQKQNVQSRAAISNIVAQLHERSRRFGSFLSQNASLCVLFFQGMTKPRDILGFYELSFSRIRQSDPLYTKIVAFILRQGSYDWDRGLALVCSLPKSAKSNLYHSGRKNFVINSMVCEWENLFSLCGTWMHCALAFGHMLKRKDHVSAWRIYLQVFRFAQRSSHSANSSESSPCTLPEPICMQLIWKVIRQCRDIPRQSRMIMSSIMMQRRLWEHAFIISQAQNSLEDAHMVLQNISEGIQGRQLWRYALSLKSGNTIHLAKRYQFENILRDLAQKCAVGSRDLSTSGIPRSAVWFTAMHLLEQWNYAPKKWPFSRPPYHLSPYASALLFSIPGMPKPILDTLMRPESLLGDQKLDSQLLSRMSESEALCTIKKHVQNGSEISFLLTKSLSIGPQWMVAISTWCELPETRTHGHLLNLLFDKHKLRQAIDISCGGHSNSFYRASSSNGSQEIENITEKLISRAAPLTLQLANFFVRSSFGQWTKNMQDSSLEGRHTLAKNFFLRLHYAETMRFVLSHCPRGNILFQNHFFRLKNLCNWDIYDFLHTFCLQRALRGSTSKYMLRNSATFEANHASIHFIQTILRNSSLSALPSQDYDIRLWLRSHIDSPCNYKESQNGQPESYGTHENQHDENCDEENLDISPAEEKLLAINGLNNNEEAAARLPFEPTWQVALCHFSSIISKDGLNQVKISHEPVILDNSSREKIRLSENASHNPHSLAYYLMILKSLIVSTPPCSFHHRVKAYISPLWWWWYMVRINSPRDCLPLEYYGYLTRILWFATRFEAKIIMLSIFKSYKKQLVDEDAHGAFASSLRFLQDLILRRGNQGTTSWHRAFSLLHALKRWPAQSQVNGDLANKAFSSMMVLNYAIAALRDYENEEGSSLPLRTMAQYIKTVSNRSRRRAPSRQWQRRAFIECKKAHHQLRLQNFWVNAFDAFRSSISNNGWFWEHESACHARTDDSLRMGPDAMRCPFTSAHATLFESYGSFPIDSIWKGCIKDRNTVAISSKKKKISRDIYPSVARVMAQVNLFGYELPSLLSNFLCLHADLEALCRILFGVLRTELRSSNQDSSIFLEGFSAALHKEFHFIAQSLGHVRFKLKLAPKLSQNAILRTVKFLYTLEESSLMRLLGYAEGISQGVKLRTATSHELNSLRLQPSTTFQNPSLMYIPHEALRVQATAEYYLRNMNYKEWIRIIFRNFRAHPALITRLIVYIAESSRSASDLHELWSAPSSLINAIESEYHRSKEKAPQKASDTNGFLYDDFLSKHVRFCETHHISMLIQIFLILIREDTLFIDAVEPAIETMLNHGWGKESVYLLAHSINRTFFLSETWIPSVLEEEHKASKVLGHLGSMNLNLSSMEGATMRPISDFRSTIIRALQRAPLKTMDWRYALICIHGLSPTEILKATKRCWKTSLYALASLSRHISSRNIDAMSCTPNFLYATQKKTGMGDQRLLRAFLCGLSVLHAAKKRSAVSATVTFMAQEGLFDANGVVRRLARRMSLSGQRLFAVVRGFCSTGMGKWSDAVALCLKNYKQCHIATLLHPLQRKKTPWDVSLMLMALAIAQGLSRHLVVRPLYIDCLSSCLDSLSNSSKGTVFQALKPAWATDVIPIQKVFSLLLDEKSSKNAASGGQLTPWGEPMWYYAMEQFASFRSNDTPCHESFYLSQFRIFGSSRTDVVPRLYHACHKDMVSQEILYISLRCAAEQNRWKDCLRMALGHGLKLGQFIQGPLRSKIIDTITANSSISSFLRCLLVPCKSGLQALCTTSLCIESIDDDNWMRIMARCSQFGRWQHLLELAKPGIPPQVIQSIESSSGLLHQPFVRALSQCSPSHLHHFVMSQHDFFICVEVMLHKYELLLHSVQSLYTHSDHEKDILESDKEAIAYILRHPVNRSLLKYILDLSEKLIQIAYVHPEYSAFPKLWKIITFFILNRIPHEMIFKFCWKPFREKKKGIYHSDAQRTTQYSDEDLNETRNDFQLMHFSEILSISNLSLWVPLQKCVRYCSSYMSVSISLNEIFEALYSAKISTEKLRIKTEVLESISDVGYSRFLAKALFTEILHRKSVKYCTQSWNAALSILKTALSLWLTVRKSSLIEMSCDHRSDESESASKKEFLFGHNSGAHTTKDSGISIFAPQCLDHSKNWAKIEGFLQSSSFLTQNRSLTTDQEVQDEVYAACTSLLRRMTSYEVIKPPSHALDQLTAAKTDFEEMIFSKNNRKSDAEALSMPRGLSLWMIALRLLCSTPEAVKSSNHNVRTAFFHAQVEDVSCRYRFYQDFFGRFCYIIARYVPASWKVALDLSCFGKVAAINTRLGFQPIYCFNEASASRYNESYLFPVSWANPTNITGILNLLRRNQLWKESVSVFKSFHAQTYTSTPFASPPFRNQLKAQARIDDILRTSRPTVRALFDSGQWKLSILLLEKYIAPHVLGKIVSSPLSSCNNNFATDIAIYPIKLTLTLYRYSAKSCVQQNAWKAAYNIYLRAADVYNHCYSISNSRACAKKELFPLSLTMHRAFTDPQLHMELIRIFGTMFCDIADYWQVADGSFWMHAMQLYRSFVTICNAFRASTGGSALVDDLNAIKTYVTGMLFDLGPPLDNMMSSLHSMQDSLVHQSEGSETRLIDKHLSFLQNKALHALSKSKPGDLYDQISRSLQVCPIGTFLQFLITRDKQASCASSKLSVVEKLFSTIKFSNSTTHVCMALHYAQSINDVDQQSSNAERSSALYLYHIARINSFGR